MRGVQKSAMKIACETSRQNPRPLPRNPRKTFKGRNELFDPRRTQQSRAPKVNLCALFSCLSVPRCLPYCLPNRTRTLVATMRFSLFTRSFCKFFGAYSRLFQRFRKRVGGGGCDQKRPKYSKHVPQNCALLFLGGHRTKGAEQRPEFMVWEGVPCANTPSVRQPLFEASDFVSAETRTPKWPPF